MIHIYKGPTGCGKTYQAMTRYGKKVILYCAPCRQLVYETACKYGDTNSNVLTSDICVGNKYKYNKSFRTYECVSEKDIRKCDIFVVDEAHFMENKERGDHLQKMISFADRINKKVILLSATMNFAVQGAKVINLNPRGQQFLKVETPLDECLERMEAGVPTLVFHKYRDNCGCLGNKYGIKTGVITSKTSVNDRIKIIDAYIAGKITLIESTNAMAQGVNIPCENLIDLAKNQYDSDATIVQKFGRLGRTGVTKEESLLTYHFSKRNEKEIKTLCNNFNKEEYHKPLLKIKEFKFSTENKKPLDRDLLTPATQLEVTELRNRIIKYWEKRK